MRLLNTRPPAAPRKPFLGMGWGQPKEFEVVNLSFRPNSENSEKSPWQGRTEKEIRELGRPEFEFLIVTFWYSDLNNEHLCLT